MQQSETRLIFLDVDGILNTDRTINNPNNDVKSDEIFPDPRDPFFVPLEKRCVENLCRLCERTGAGIVLTTSWRLGQNQRAFLCDVLEGRYNLTIIGDTEVVRGSMEDVDGCKNPTMPRRDSYRGEEISRFLRQAEQEGHSLGSRSSGKVDYVILEDEERHLLSFRDAALDLRRVIRCVMKCTADRGLEGLTVEKCEEAERILLGGVDVNGTGM